MEFEDKPHRSPEYDVKPLEVIYPSKVKKKEVSVSKQEVSADKKVAEETERVRKTVSAERTVDKDVMRAVLLGRKLGIKDESIKELARSMEKTEINVCYGESRELGKNQWMKIDICFSPTLSQLIGAKERNAIARHLLSQAKSLVKDEIKSRYHYQVYKKPKE